jgi:hypothetical protein
MTAPPWIDAIFLLWPLEAQIEWWLLAAEYRSVNVPAERADLRAFDEVRQGRGLPRMVPAQSVTKDDEAPIKAHRIAVHPMTCGGCGTKALLDEGRGPCWRCGWRKTGKGTGT